MLEGLLSTNHDVQQDSQTPDVNLSSRVLDALKQLGCGVVRRPNEGVELHVSCELAAEPKVDDLHIIVLVEQDICKV